jgi:hypothetical protein
MGPLLDMSERGCLGSVAMDYTLYNYDMRDTVLRFKGRGILIDNGGLLSKYPKRVDINNEEFYE